MILYSGTGCHLCDQARAVIDAVLPAGWHIRTVLIDDSPELRERYGTRIPVVARGDDGREKGWPFSPGQVRKLIEDA